MAGYEIFKSFYNETEATDMMNLLLEHGIHAKTEKTKPILDKVITGDNMQPSLHLKIDPVHFEKAHQILEDYIRMHIDQAEPDYYLYSFSDNELMEILKKPEEWNHQDIIIAQKILNERGKPVTDNQVNRLRAERIQQLAVVEKEDPVWIVYGYLLTILVSLAGFFFGLFLLTTKKLLPDGTKVMMYARYIRIHGLVMMMLSAVYVVLAIKGVVPEFWVIWALF
jgi:hypothetical protein